MNNNLVILGGGYGGLTVAHELLGDELPPNVDLILVDRMPFQGLKTEYYALAAGTVSDHDIRVHFPNDSRLRKHYGNVTELDLENKQVHFEGQDPLPYRWLIIALGCTDNYHDIPGAQEHSVSIQSFSQSRVTYQRLNDVKPYGQVSIVGGGLSGVEMAAELRESRPDLNIRILDRGRSILSAFPEKLQDYVRSWFYEHHVEMIGNVAISRLEPGVIYDRDQPIVTDETVWTAGIQPVDVVQKLALSKDKTGRLTLDSYHRLPSYPDVFVVGDCASLPFSPSAQAAEGQGKQVAEVLIAEWAGKIPQLQKIKLKGTLGSLGKKAGFGLMGRTSIIGRVPRVLKSGVLWLSKNHLG